MNIITRHALTAIWVATVMTSVTSCSSNTVKSGQRILSENLVKMYKFDLTVIIDEMYFKNDDCKRNIKLIVNNIELEGDGYFSGRVPQKGEIFEILNNTKTKILTLAHSQPCGDALIGKLAVRLDDLNDVYSKKTEKALKQCDPAGLNFIRLQQINVGPLYGLWLEGPSGSESTDHRSICVGNPLGNYRSFSFGIDLPNPLVVFPDESQGWKMLKFVKINAKQAGEITMNSWYRYDKSQNNGRMYPFVDTSKSWSNRRFNEFLRCYSMTLSAPPSRSVVPRVWWPPHI